jgi:hypothetical protein
VPLGFWSIVAAQIVAGSVVALVVAAVAVLVTSRYTNKMTLQQARRERDLAAAAELYRIHGAFFAAWKAWEFHTNPKKDDRAADPPDVQRRRQLLDSSANVEGGYESLLVRIALEHDLKFDQEAALWCLRFAFKELRKAIRENKPLGWWRSDIRPDAEASVGHRKYEAFKNLVAVIGGILVERTVQPRSESAKIRDRAAVLRSVTSSGQRYKESPRFHDRIIDEKQQNQARQIEMRHNWEWLPIAEQLDGNVTSGRSTAAESINQSASTTR